MRPGAYTDASGPRWRRRARQGGEPSAAPAAGGSGGVTVGVRGRSIRASVTPCGDVTPWGVSPEAPTLSWYVAADDRWHVPAAESTVRQRRVDGTPVVETRVRVPDGDACQRVWSVPDHGGITVVEVRNDSPLPFAVAFAGADVLTERPPAEVPVQGIELPDDTVVMPVGHHASVRVGLAHDADRLPPATVDRSAPSRLPAVPDSDSVVRGWIVAIERAGRLDLPDPRLVDEVTGARADLLLGGPIDPEADPVDFLLDLAQLVRLGDGAEEWLPEVAGAIEAIARDGGADAARAIRAAGRVVTESGDDRAARDIERLLARRGDEPPRPLVAFADLKRQGSAGRFLSDIEELFAAGGALLPLGIPTPWLGANFAVEGVPTGIGSTVGFAVRWHGDRPAVLWEQQGPVVDLTAPGVDQRWSSRDRSGDALWVAPAPRRTVPLAPRT